MHPKLKDITAQRKVLVDWPTALVITAMVVGFPALGFAVHMGHIPWWAALIGGTILMNLSFTAWHESSHGSFSRIGWVNTAAGIIASAASVYPGYFARRREHLVHHKWEGIDGKDPVYPRIQTSFFGFAFRLAYLTVVGVKSDVPDSFHPITPRQRLADHLSNGFALAVLIGCIAFGAFGALLWVWILPRIIVFLLHAYYICFLPHNVPEGGYVKYRVRDGNWLYRLTARLITVDQSFHGIHHLWPFIPWHRYAAVLRDPELRQELEQAGVQMQSGLRTSALETVVSDPHAPLPAAKSS